MKADITSACLTLHLCITGRAIHFHAFCSRDPQNVVASYQHLTQSACLLAIDEFFRIVQLDVHVGVDTDERAFVFCLTPLQSHDHFVVDPGPSVSRFRNVYATFLVLWYVILVVAVGVRTMIEVKVSD